MKSDVFTAWITRYALSAGIRKIQARETEHPGMIEEVGGNNIMPYYHGEGNDWHRTPEAALKRAEAMRDAKIKSHQASISKLQKLKFNA